MQEVKGITQQADPELTGQTVVPSLSAAGPPLQPPVVLQL